MNADKFEKKEQLLYPVNVFKGIDAYSVENTMPLTTAPMAYNVDFFGGVLTEGYGIKSCPVGEGENVWNTLSSLNPKKVWGWKVFDIENNCPDDRIVVWCGDTEGERAGGIYVLYVGSGLVLDTTFRVTNCEINAILNYKYESRYGFFIMTSTGDVYLVYNNLLDTAPNILPMRDVCHFNQRVFCVCDGFENRIFYSDNPNPKKWNESFQNSGYVNLDNDGRGRSERVIAYKENVYVFREYGISRLTTYTNSNVVRNTNVLSFKGKLYPKTVVNVDKYVMFLTTAGLYRFDGFNVTRCFDEAVALVDKGALHSTAWYYDSKYYLACKIATHGEPIGDEQNPNCLNNAVLICDVELKNVTVMRGADIAGFFEVEKDGELHLMTSLRGDNANLLAEIVPDHGKYLQNNWHKYWQTPYSDLNENNRLKVIRRIFLNTKYDLTMTIKVDGEDFVYQLKGSDKAQSVSVNLTGDKFSVSFSAQSEKLKILNFKLELEYLWRYHGQQ